MRTGLITAFIMATTVHSVSIQNMAVKQRAEVV